MIRFHQSDPRQPSRRRCAAQSSDARLGVLDRGLARQAFVKGLLVAAKGGGANRMVGRMARKRLRLLVAIDFSPESRKALQAARALAARFGGSLTLLHVRPHSDIRAAVVEERGELLKGKPGTLRGEIARHYARRLERFAGRHPGELHKLRRGKPSIELRREARDGYDLLVMGSRGRGKVAASLLGSTVQEALACGSPVPVLVVGS